MKKIILTILSIAVIVFIILCIVLINNKNEDLELVSVKNKAKLEKIYDEGYYYDNDDTLLRGIFSLPLSFLIRNTYRRYSGYYDYNDYVISDVMTEDSTALGIARKETSSVEPSTGDYSKTNIQVENVDEADIIKTDGEYIYSLSEDKVIITDVKNPEEIKIASEITTSGFPEDMILFENKLVIVEQKDSYSSSNQYYYSSRANNNTLVEIYDIQDRENPKSIKNFELYEPYYTTRCIDGRLYVIASGSLRKDSKDIITYYNEDRNRVEIDLKDIKYIKDKETRDQTLISMIDLKDLGKSVKVSSYLMNVENAYIAENNMYLLDNTYENTNESKVGMLSIFGLRGIFGYEYALDNSYDYDDYGQKTKIYKFNILEDGTIKYANMAVTKGTTINQFSLDEYNGNLRIALSENYSGSRIEIYDENMKKIGETSVLAEGEKMYSSRFMGNKAYLVTYQTIDPLFVIDLSDPTNPKVEGELKIPGYSTYLHPYDETHLIGIGMQTKETVNRDYYTGRVTSKTARITGMKMALFDVSDVNNPKQISEVEIGDSRTTSAILTNHKALLFSKEKELLAIPVNNYEEDFEIDSSTDEYDTMITAYTSKSNYVSEGYLVYNINLTDGISQKGSVVHDYSIRNNDYDYYYYSYGTSRLLRGLYIKDNLFTVSEEQIKANKLSDMSEIGTLNIIDKADEYKEDDIIVYEE